MTRVLALSAIVTAAFTSVASALTVTVAENGVEANILDNNFEAFYVVETETATGGAYTIHNNTTNLTLAGFGVTNGSLDAQATIDGNTDGGFITQSDGNNANLWDAFELIDDNWFEPFKLLDSNYDGFSANELFGPDEDVLSDAEPIAMYFQLLDASALGAGLSASDFGFINSVPASSLFGVANDDQGNVFAFINGQVVGIGGPAPVVPLPAAGWMLIAGLGGLAAMRRKS